VRFRFALHFPLFLPAARAGSRSDGGAFEVAMVPAYLLALSIRAVGG